MNRSFLVVAAICLVGVVSANPSHLSYFYPVEHRSDLRGPREAIPLDNYDLQIIPSDQTAETELTSVGASIWDYIPNPITVLTTVASKALSVTKLLILNGLLVVLGIALVIGFCAFTPYATLTIHKPFTRNIISLSNSIPYLDEVENFVIDSYDKYQQMQKAW